MNALALSQPHDWIDLGHARIPHWRFGRGPDLLFIHGWPLTGATWRNVVPHLVDQFTCHVVDLPGAGQSQWTDETTLSIAALGVDVTAITRAVATSGPVGLIGHDSGGTFARIAAAELGDTVSGLVLGNTEITGHHPWRLAALLPLARLPGARHLWAALLRSRFARWLLLRDAYSDTTKIEGELVPNVLAPLIESQRLLAGSLALAASIRVTDFDVVGEAHRRIRGPVRLVWGADDPWFPLEKCRAMCSEFNAPVALVEVPNAKLLVHEEHPARFAEEIRRNFAA